MNNVIGAAFGGKVSVTSLVANLNGDTENLRTLIVVAIDKDDKVRVGSTQGSRCELLGMLRVAEDHILEQMKNA